MGQHPRRIAAIGTGGGIQIQERLLQAAFAPVVTGALAKGGEGGVVIDGDTIADKGKYGAGADGGWFPGGGA